ncbi:MAG TPA: crosslink repair DNA glycosylase YcaQ family protein [Kineosporiaceae bacterium]|nr:crosslink repair DNA glycosylase YcaQ family protein [Kineosporiaceae bacterium]
MTIPLSRSAVLAYRAAAHGLDRQARGARDVPGLPLGVQDSPPGNARLALAARTDASGSEIAEDPARWERDPALTVAWSIRAAPHVHRNDDLRALAAALWPLDDADAAARLAWNAARVRDSGIAPLTAIELAAATVAEIATVDPGTIDLTGLEPRFGPDGELALTKAMLSREATRRLPAALRRWCAPCGVEHLSEQLLRLATLPAGLMIASSAPVTFVPIPGWPGVPAAPEGGDRLVRAFLHLYSPAVPSDAKTFFSASTSSIASSWPPDAVEVTVQGRRAWAMPEDLARLVDPPAPPAARLLPPNDPFLKAADRGLLVPDRAEQKQIWRTLGSPGVLLLDAMPAGTWRPKTSGKRLEVIVSAFGPLPAGILALLEAEAGRMAAVRDLSAAHVTLA